MLRFILSILLIHAALCKPNCGGKMNAYMDFTPGNHANCSCDQIDQPNGDILGVIPFSGCSDRTGASNGPAASIFDYDLYGMLFMTGTGSYMWDMNLMSKQAFVWGNLPTTYNYTLGLAQFSMNGLYIVTTSTIYYANSSDPVPRTFRPIAMLDLSTNAAVGSSYWVPVIYIMDGSTLYTVDVTIPGSPQVSSMMTTGDLSSKTISTMSLYVPSQPDLPYLVGVGSDYGLYALDPTTAISKLILNLPTDNPPLPRASTIMDTEIFYVDNVNIYDVDFVAMAILNTSPFETAQLEGNIQIHP